MSVYILQLQYWSLSSAKYPVIQLSSLNMNLSAPRREFPHVSPPKVCHLLAIFPGTAPDAVKIIGATYHRKVLKMWNMLPSGVIKHTQHKRSWDIPALNRGFHLGKSNLEMVDFPANHVWFSEGREVPAESECTNCDCKLQPWCSNSASPPRSPPMAFLQQSYRNLSWYIMVYTLTVAKSQAEMLLLKV